MMLHRIQVDIGNHVFPNDIKVAFSAGICQYKNNMKLTQLIKFADQALYTAKENGRNRTEIYIEKQASL